MSEGRKWASVVRKMTKDTDNGTLHWTPAAEVVLENEQQQQDGVAYRVDIEGRTFEVVPIKYRHYVDVDEWHWRDAVLFRIINSKGLTRYAPPITTSDVPFASSGTESLKGALLQSIQRAAIKSGEFFDAYIPDVNSGKDDD